MMKTQTTESKVPGKECTLKHISCENHMDRRPEPLSTTMWENTKFPLHLGLIACSK